MRVDFHKAHLHVKPIFKRAFPLRAFFSFFLDGFDYSGKKKCPVIYNMLCITMFKLCLCLDVKKKSSSSGRYGPI